MRNDVLEDALKLALRLTDICKSQRFPAEEADIMKILSKRLQRVACVPTAVVAGRAGLRYKVRAMLHSIRLVSPSWMHTARLACSSFSNTGDLGTESDMCTVNTNLESIFGDWACDDGHELNADDLAFAFGQEEVNPDPSFMMVPEEQLE